MRECAVARYRPAGVGLISVCFPKESGLVAFSQLALILPKSCSSVPAAFAVGDVWGLLLLTCLPFVHHRHAQSCPPSRLAMDFPSGYRLSNGGLGKPVVGGVYVESSAFGPLAFWRPRRSRLRSRLAAARRKPRAAFRAATCSRSPSACSRRSSAATWRRNRRSWCGSSSRNRSSRSGKRTRPAATRCSRPIRSAAGRASSAPRSRKATARRPRGSTPSPPA